MVLAYMYTCMSVYHGSKSQNSNGKLLHATTSNDFFFMHIIDNLIFCFDLSHNFKWKNINTILE